MQSAQILNLGPAPSPSPSSSPSGSEKDEAIEQTTSDVRRLRRQLEEQESRQEDHARRTKVLSIILGVLIVLLAGAVWFEYPTLRDQRKAAAELVGLQGVASALGERVSGLEGKLDQATAGLPALADRMDQLQATMKSGLQTARSQAQAAATQVGQKIRADMTAAIGALQSRMSGLESNQHEASERMNQLQGQVAGLQKELASMREESSAATETIKQLQAEQQNRAAAISTMDQRMTSHQATLDSLSKQVDRQRTEFSLPAKRTEQIVPGIYLTIRRTDTGKQELDGTLQLGADSRMMTIRGQGIQKPVIFYRSGEERSIEVVFTQVEKNRVAGYVVQ